MNQFKDFYEDPTVLWAENGAFSAQIALPRMMGADRFAFSALRTFLSVKQHLRVGALAFGVVAPLAPQVTSFKEHGRSDAWAICVGAPLNVKYRSFHPLLPVKCRGSFFL